MKHVIGFPLEGQTVAAPDGLPRATCALPVGAQVLHLGVAYPADVICIFALVEPPVPESPGEPPRYREMQTLEFIVLRPGMPAPPADFLYRGPVRAKQTLEDGSVIEGLIFLFEKQAPKLRIVTAGGRG
jgi:hypothetical protein